MLVNSPFLPAIKSAGGLTFSKWKGLNTARARVFKNGSKTPKQIFQRDKFAYLMSIRKLLLKVVLEGWWKPYENNTTYINEWLKANLPEQPVYVNDSTPFAGDLSKIIMSLGDLAECRLAGDQTYDTATGALSLNWSTTLSGNAEDTDLINIQVINLEEKYQENDDYGERQDGSGSDTLPTGMTATDIHLYCTPYRILIDGSVLFGNSFHKVCVAA